MAASPDALERLVTPKAARAVLERGYDQVGGPVIGAGDLAELGSDELLSAWGMRYPGTPFAADSDQVFLLRFPVHPLMALTTPRPDSARPWPTYPLGSLPAPNPTPVWLLERTRLPPGSQLLRRSGYDERPLASYRGPAWGWQDADGHALAYVPPLALVGTRARWSDLDVPAEQIGDGAVELVSYSAEAPDGFQLVRPSVWRRVVALGEVSLFEVIWICRFQGVPCRLLQRMGDHVRLLILDDDPDLALRLGAEEVDVGTFETTVPYEVLAGVSGTARKLPYAPSSEQTRPEAALHQDQQSDSGPVQGLLEHLESHLGTIDGGWRRDPNGNRMPFQLVRYRDQAPPGCLILTTFGLSSFALDRGRIELMMIAPERLADGPLPGFLLRIGQEILRHRELPLYGDLFTNFGPLRSVSTMDTLYVGRPLYHAAQFGEFDNGTQQVTIAWLMPVSAAEADYIRARGVREFEQLMRDHDIDPTNFNRASML